MTGRLSVTARIALLSILLALISNLCLVVVVWKQTHDNALDTVRWETVEQADALRTVWRTGGLAAVAEAIRNSRAPGDASLLLAIVDGQGRRIAGYGPDRLAVPLNDIEFTTADLEADGDPREVGYALRRIGNHWLLAGRTLDLVASEQRAIERALGVAVALSLALGVVAGLVLARYVGRRLDGIAQVIEAAGAGDLSRRVAVSTPGTDAFDRLAARLNAMLAKVERLMVELRVVTDGLAHDLRSPIARLRTKAEQAVLVADPQAREAALGSLLVETDLVMAMLTTVIEISRAESVSRDRFVAVALDTLVEELAELYAPVVEDAGLAFHVATETGSLTMRVHRELLSQAIANLIDNALKYAPAGGEITLRCCRTANGVAIQVEDRGPGIARTDQAEALRRFGRLDSARTRPGAGLGMALIDAVARLHDGRFELADNAPGLVAKIVVPV